MHRTWSVRVLAVVVLFVCLRIQAAPPPVEFSAEAVQTGPQGQAMQQTMYLGAEGRVRMESSAQGQTVIQIIDPVTRKMYMMMPARKTYMERTYDGAAQLQHVTAGSNPDPCAGVPGAKCKLLGKEEVNGRAAEKWELVQTNDGETYRILYWIDAERRMPLRQFLPDGSTSEMQLVGNEVMNGRQTEKWLMTMTKPGGDKMESAQWYDPELKISIREELPGGAYRELRNIRVEKQSPELFTVPAEFKKVAAPQQGRPSGQPPQGVQPYGQRR